MAMAPPCPTPASVSCRTLESVMALLDLNTKLLPGPEFRQTAPPPLVVVAVGLTMINLELRMALSPVSSTLPVRATLIAPPPADGYQSGGNWAAALDGTRTNDSTMALPAASVRLPSSRNTAPPSTWPLPTARESRIMLPPESITLPLLTAIAPPQLVAGYKTVLPWMRAMELTMALPVVSVRLPSSRNTAPPSARLEPSAREFRTTLPPESTTLLF